MSFEPLIGMDSQGLKVISPQVAEKLEKKSLSPSLVSGLSKCPAKWFAESFVLRDLIEEEPDTPARRGNVFHSVMENFFDLEAEGRTPDVLKKIMKDTLYSDDYKDLAENSEVRQWLSTAVGNYYKMGARPQNVEVATITDNKGKERKGLEVFVKGNIGGTKRDILGFVDRLVVNRDKNGNEKGLIIEDWKTGAKVKKWNPKTKGDDGLEEARQQVIYSEILKAEGKNIIGARLIFPMPQEVVNVDLKDEDFLNRVKADVREADQKLDLMIERNNFEYGPSFLCAWCPLARLCPVATIKPYAKMQEAYAKQPSTDILVQGIEIL